MTAQDDSIHTAATCQTLRLPCVAVRHYPENPNQLADMVDSLLDAVAPVDGEPTVLIAPHGKYATSGAVMAQAYRQILGGVYDDIVIVGHYPQHTHRPGFAVWTQGPWQTPLGPVPVDQALAKTLVQASGHFFDNPAPHRAANTIETQLPFLQRVCPDRSIVPILIGNPNHEAIDQCANLLSQVLADRKALIIISTNLCQHPAYDDARRVDSATLFAIETLDTDEVARSVAYAMRQGIPGLSKCACEDRLLLLALKLAQTMKVGDVKVLGYANSGDAPEADQSRVVGYAAVMFWNWQPISMTSDDEEVLLQLVRDSIAAELSGAERPAIPTGSASLHRRSAVFVTLRQGGELRGCTGDVSGKRLLGEAVQHAALTAAFSDPRFPPLTAQELAVISVDISVLSPWKRVLDPEMIQVGVHGLVLRSGGCTGLLLPQVASDRGWDREQFLAAVCRKAGARENAWRMGALLYTFTAQVFGDEQQ